MIKSDSITGLEAFYLARADLFHAALFVIGGLTVAQTIAFSNMVASGEAIGCRVADPLARGLVYLFLVAFCAAYHAGIRFCAQLEAAYRDYAGVDVGHLARRTARAVAAVNLATTASSVAVFTAALFLNSTAECAS
ncbi:MAG: hypothetical protein AAGJ87_09115 [Pseudomonadota bacterium]